MSQTVIKVENLSKLYRLGQIGTGTLSHDLNRWWAQIRGKEDPFAKIGHENDRSKKAEKGEMIWALKDINFEVKQGEVIGIIGKNGAGKSTLLKILSQVTTPTTGHVNVRGRIASLLEVGTGFHPELTGRENIFLNGAIMGMTKAEIRSKFDEIVDFAGVAKYVDTPVKRYSSGMYVRLAFAVAAHLEPEILIVDEVLAVGDAEFQKKALGKMQDVSKTQGRTVLFVSHNMAAVNDLCKNAILLSKGIIEDTGYVKEIINKYLSSDIKINIYNEWEQTKEAPGNNDIKIKKICSVDKNMDIVQYSTTTNKIGIYIEYETFDNLPFFTHGINLYTTSGLHLLSSHDNSGFDKKAIVEKGKYYTIAWLPSHLLQSGDYFISVAFMRYNPFDILFNAENLLTLKIIDTIEAKPEDCNEIIPGLIRPKCDWLNRVTI